MDPSIANDVFCKKNYSFYVTKKLVGRVERDYDRKSGVGEGIHLAAAAAERGEEEDKKVGLQLVGGSWSAAAAAAVKIRSGVCGVYGENSFRQRRRGTGDFFCGLFGFQARDLHGFLKPNSRTQET